jgi:peptide/nickel transport system permease protein
LRYQPPSLIAGLCLLSLVLGVAVVGPLLTPNDPLRIDMGSALVPPGRTHPLGTDHLGRDVLSRIVSGARISISVGVAVVLPTILIGIALGSLAGYFGGALDEALMRTCDVFLSFPILVLAMAIAVALGRGLSNAAIAMVIVMWPAYARLLRSQAITVRGQEYVEAARSLGLSNLKIILRHVVPNCLDAVIAQGSMDVGNVIILVSALSFLGMGAQPPTPEWGAMIRESRIYLREAWWISTFPGVALFITVTAFTLIGDGWCDRLDRS